MLTAREMSSKVRRRATLAAAATALAALAFAVPAQARRDNLSDTGTLFWASCDNAAYGTDAADQLTALGSQSLTGLGGNDELTGALGSDCLTGGDGDDQLTGADSSTWIEGGPGRDRVAGAAAADDIKGDEGNDVIYGGAGNDVIDGGAGDDTIYGGPGSDTITGGSGHNAIYGGPGDDLIAAGDGSRELVDCGPGADTVHADRFDRLVHCEHVGYRANPFPVVTPRTGSRTTVFTIRYVAPYGALIPANDEGTAGYDYDIVSRPSSRCHADTTLTAAHPVRVVYGSHVVDRITVNARSSACRGRYRFAVDYHNSSLEVECDSIRATHPHRRGDYGSCGYTETIGYFSLRIR